MWYGAVTQMNTNFLFKTVGWSSIYPTKLPCGGYVIKEQKLKTRSPGKNHRSRWSAYYSGGCQKCMSS